MYKRQEHGYCLFVHLVPAGHFIRVQASSELEKTCGRATHCGAVLQTPSVHTDPGVAHP